MTDDERWQLSVAKDSLRVRTAGLVGQLAARGSLSDPATRGLISQLHYAIETIPAEDPEPRERVAAINRIKEIEYAVNLLEAGNAGEALERLVVPPQESRGIMQGLSVEAWRVARRLAGLDPFPPDSGVAPLAPQLVLRGPGFDSWVPKPGLSSEDLPPIASALGDHAKLVRQIQDDGQADLGDLQGDDVQAAIEAGNALDQSLITFFLSLGPPPTTSSEEVLTPVNSGGGTAG